MIGDMPAIGSSSYGANTAVFGLANNGFQLGGAQQLGALNNIGAQDFKAQMQQLARVIDQPQPKQEKAAMASRRLVQVFIADPDENVSLEQSLLYSGEQKLTDATDQELFFEIDIKSVLEAHNAKRAVVINKKVKERTEFLEPAKIRDLKMVVVNVATF